MAQALTLEEKRERSMEKSEARKEAAQGERKRERRSAFNGTRSKLSVGHGIPGYHLHIFNDTKDGRIQAAQDSGYEFVSPEEVGGVSSNVTDRNTDIGDKVRFLVGMDNNEPMYAYLMKIKQEWYDEDQAEIQARNNKTDAAIKGGKLATEQEAGFYNAGIKIGK